MNPFPDLFFSEIFMNERQHKPTIGITIGDFNGIGPEVILKAMEGNHLSNYCTPVIYGSGRVLNRYRQLYQMKDLSFYGAPGIEQINRKQLNVINCWNDQQAEIEPGKITPAAGKAALASLQKATEDLKAGKIHALVTAPINKDNMQSEEFKFPGHTEYLASLFSASPEGSPSREALMLMVADKLRIGVLTGHIPLGKVRSQVTQDKLRAKIKQMLRSLRFDFGILKPRVAVLGLNPHAGENGLLGSEERDVIHPVINELREKGELVSGTFPADGFFGTAAYRGFDGVLAMYHDQGLIPFKTIAFNEGVNFTADLTVVRTSPDHGTAYDIAGKNVAEPGSMLQAIHLACDIWQMRAENAELAANALGKVALPT